MSAQRCIFCLEERSGTVEHVFPLAIGGTLTFDRVCQRCNSDLGSRVDAALVNNFLIRSRRAKLVLAGNSGEVPALHELLLGVSRLAGKPEQRIQTTYNRDTGKLDIRALHYAEDVTLHDGSKARRIVIDVRDKAQIPTIIQRERRRHRVPPLPPEELRDEVRRWTAEEITTVNPQVIIEKSFSFAFVRHAMLKIAYELAVLWLGDDYLEDQSAADLRTAILSVDPNSTNTLPAAVIEANSCDLFHLWPSDYDHHLAFAIASDDGIAIAVRVFDIFAAVVWVTADAARYLSAPDAQKKLRFLAIDPINQKMRQTTLMEEQLRIVQAMKSARR